MAGKILSDLAIEIIRNENVEIKRSGVNIINSFFDVAKQTEDEQLIHTAMEISSNVNGAIGPAQALAQ